MNDPKYKYGALIQSSDNKGLIIGVIVGAKWGEKISEWNMKCGAGFEDDSENKHMWLYEIEAIGRKKRVKVYEDDIEGIISVEQS